METVERHVTLPATREEVWALLTRPEDLSTWLGDDVELEPTSGAAGLVVERDGSRRSLVVEEVVEGHRLSWRWWREGDDPATHHSRVEITLSPTDDGTVLRVVEQPVGGSHPDAPAAGAQARASAAAWSHRLLHLEALLLLAAAVRG